MSEKADLEVRFTYHPPKTGQPEKYEKIRSQALKLAELLCDLCPECRERSLAITKLEEVVFWSNAAIARDRVSPVL
jgi:hypothetical protein